MLKTPLCALLGIDVPILLAPMGACGTSAEVARIIAYMESQASPRLGEGQHHVATWLNILSAATTSVTGNSRRSSNIRQISRSTGRGAAFHAAAPPPASRWP
jgi:hypothetical protein